VVQIVKLGGSVITTKGQAPEIRHDALERLADELAGCADDLVLVHGAGSLGHPLAQAHELDAGVENDQLDGLSELHHQVRELNLAVLDAVRRNAGPCLSLAPYGQLGANDGQPGGWNLVPVHRTLEMGTVPILFGDVVLDTQRGVSVLSGDRIAVELARFLDAERVVFALDEAGAYSHPPGDDRAQLLEQPSFEDVREARDRARKDGPDDATGGMATKLDCTLAIARAGTEVALVGGNEAGRLADALAGEVTGTLVEEGQ
jgi:isopentenyl phosphate kinase